LRQAVENPTAETTAKQAAGEGLHCIQIEIGKGSLNSYYENL